MDAARALADLLEISPHVEAAAVFGAAGEELGSVGVAEASAAELARAGRDLLDEAAALADDGASVTQLHVTLPDGDVFAVRGPDARSIVAVAAAGVQPGLVFYDLKRCLASLAEDGGG